METNTVTVTNMIEVSPRIFGLRGAKSHMDHCVNVQIINNFLKLYRALKFQTALCINPCMCASRPLFFYLKHAGIMHFCLRRMVRSINEGTLNTQIP